MKECLDYDQLCEIPTKIREHAESELKNDPKAYALARRDELLTAWFTTMLSGKRFAGELDFGWQPKCVMLFKDKIDHSGATAIPEWAQQALTQNSLRQFWQLHSFPYDVETEPTRRGFLTMRLTESLEEYIEKFRPILASSRSKTLFVDNRGVMFSYVGLICHVRNLVLSYAGKLIDPRSIRALFGPRYLAFDPVDYLRRAKVLVHRSSTVPLKIYGERNPHAGILNGKATSQAQSCAGPAPVPSAAMDQAMR
jgi:hypothetical protein